MIKYALACDQAHEFESWFPSSQAYETQSKRGLVTCPVCNSSHVTKQVMAPSVGRRDGTAADKDTPALAAPDAQPVAILSEKEREMRAMLKAFRDHVTKTAENVGERFVEEARKMHYGETEGRSIYGAANPSEARALIEEGIEVLPLPHAPDDRN
jgi:hypothetical protein